MRKLVLLIILTLTSVSNAATTWNLLSATPGNWNVAANWNNGLPILVGDSLSYGTHTKAVFNMGAAGAECQVTDTRGCVNVVIGDGGPGGDVLRIMSGGTLTSTDWMAVGYSRNCQMIVETGGVANLNSHLWMAATNAAATNCVLDINGGTVNVGGNIGLGTINASTPSGGTAMINVNDGGLLNLDHWSATGSIQNGSAIDIELGVMTIVGNQTSAVQNYVAARKITAYGGSGTVHYDYNTTNLGKTTVWAGVYEKSYNPSPPDGTIGISVDADLGWMAGGYAASHDVYFGTNPTPGPPEFKGNQPETTYPLPQLEPGTRYYWRIDDVDTGNPESPWTGDIWSFTTAPEVQGTLLGTYYYPWYDDSSFHGGSPTGSTTLGYHLEPTQVRPALGWYDQDNASVISQHYEWARYAGIDFFVCSYWGMGSGEDSVIRNRMFNNPDRGDIQLCVFMEPRLTTAHSTDPATVAEMTAEMNYLCENYFDHPSYLYIDGKPVVFIYITRAMDNAEFELCLNTFRTAASSKGYELYIAGDEVWGSPSTSIDGPRVAQLDGITNYDVYGNNGAKSYVTDAVLNTWQSRNTAWKSLADTYSTDFIPAISPGYNDRTVRLASDHAACSRKLNNESSEFGTLFTGMIDRLEPDVEMVMVNSWNEWHEDTQIEPTTVAAPTNVDDSATGDTYTEGVYYEGYGLRYLDILRDTIGLVCGNGICDTGENPCNCSADCGMPALSDFNCDLNVDLEDLVYMAGVWLTDDTKADIALPADGIVNFPDFSVLSSEWSP